jgi:hypothetical protein
VLSAALRSRARRGCYFEQARARAAVTLPDLLERLAQDFQGFGLFESQFTAGELLGCSPAELDQLSPYQLGRVDEKKTE